MIVTTTPSIEGKHIVEYRGIVFGEVISGVNFIKDFAAGAYTGQNFTVTIAGTPVAYLAGGTDTAEDVRDGLLNNINLAVPPGSFLVLVGPSGCGKSTLLRMLAGLEEISGGDIAIDGKIINELDSKDRDIAMVFQSYALFPHMTVEKNVAFGLERRKVPKADVQRRVAEALDLVELGPLARRRPTQMSGGQQQRVALARALVNRPQALLLDDADQAGADVRQQLLRLVSLAGGATPWLTIVLAATPSGARRMGDELLDALDLRIYLFTRQLVAVKCLDEIQLCPLRGRGQTRAEIGHLGVGNGSLIGSDASALVNCRKEGTAVVLHATEAARRSQADEAG